MGQRHGKMSAASWQIPEKKHLLRLQVIDKYYSVDGFLTSWVCAQALLDSVSLKEEKSRNQGEQMFMQENKNNYIQI